MSLKVFTGNSSGHGYCRVRVSTAIIVTIASHNAYLSEHKVAKPRLRIEEYCFLGVRLGSSEVPLSKRDARHVGEGLYVSHDAQGFLEGLGGPIKVTEFNTGDAKAVP